MLSSLATGRPSPTPAAVGSCLVPGAELRGSECRHGSPVLPGLLPGTEAPQPQPPSTAHSPGRCSPRLQHWACAPCHGLSPNPNLSLHPPLSYLSSHCVDIRGSSHFCVCGACWRAASCCDLTRLWVPSGLRLQSFGFSARICRFSGTVCWSA